MLSGWLDKWYASREDRSGALPEEILRKPLEGLGNGNWICFVPSAILKYRFLSKKLERGCSKGVVYLLPKTAIQPDPRDTCDFLDRVLANSESLEGCEEVNVLGISLGNVLAYRFANNFPVNRLVSIVPGSKLAECAAEGISTREIVEKSKSPFREWQEALRDYDPDRNLNSLNVKSLEIYLGEKDVIIPYSRGLELLRSIGGADFTKIYHHAGHVESIVRALGDFSKRVIAK